MILKFHYKKEKSQWVSPMSNQPKYKIEIDKDRSQKETEILCKIFKEVQVKKASNFLTAKDHRQLDHKVRQSLHMFRIVDRQFSSILLLKTIHLQEIFHLLFTKSLLNKILMNWQIIRNFTLISIVQNNCHLTKKEIWSKNTNCWIRDLEKYCRL